MIQFAFEFIKFLEPFIFLELFFISLFQDEVINFFGCMLEHLKDGIVVKTSNVWVNLFNLIKFRHEILRIIRNLVPFNFFTFAR